MVQSTPSKFMDLIMCLVPRISHKRPGQFILPLLDIRVHNVRKLNVLNECKDICNPPSHLDLVEHSLPAWFRCYCPYFQFFS